MEYCYDKHDHKYLITYKPAQHGSQTSKWSVCKNCYENKSCFNNPEEIKSIALLA